MFNIYIYVALIVKGSKSWEQWQEQLRGHAPSMCGIGVSENCKRIPFSLCYLVLIKTFFFSSIIILVKI